MKIFTRKRTRILLALAIFLSSFLAFQYVMYSSQNSVYAALAASKNKEDVLDDSEEEDEEEDIEDEEEWEDEGEIEDEAMEEEEAAEDVLDMEKSFQDLTGNIKDIAASGVDTIIFQEASSELKGLIDQAKYKLETGDVKGSLSLIETAENKLDALETAVDAMAENDSEDQNESEAEKKEPDNSRISLAYKNSIAETVQDLLTLAEKEKKFGPKLREIATEQRQSQTVVENLANKILQRGRMAKAIIGPDYASLKSVEKEIEGNERRVSSLNEITNQLPAIDGKVIIKKQTGLLEKQNMELKNFITQQEKGISMFGWLVRWFV